MRTGVWLEITRGWIDAAEVTRTGVARCHRVWRAEDHAHHDALESDIASALAPFAPNPGRVRIMWSAPGAPVDLCSVPVPGAAGLRAVQLSHAAGAGLTPGVDPVAAELLDTPTRPNAESPATPSLAIAAGMSASLWASICAAVDAAGGSVQSIHISQAGALADAARAARSVPDAPLSVAVRVDEDASVIAIVINSEVALARTVDIGASALRRSYEHALRERGRADSDPNARPISETADAMLRASGVPGRNESLPHSVSADLVFQMMRPALQRIVFEVKQSIRFTAMDAAEDEESRPRPVFQLIDTAIPNLAELLARECGAAAPRASAPPDASPGARIRIAAAAPPLALEPPTNAATSTVLRFRIALGAGCALAGAALAFDAWSASSRASALEHEARAIEAHLSGADAPDESEIRFARAAEAASKYLNRDVTPVAPWSGGIATLARALGEDVRILRVSGVRDAARSVVRIDGRIAAASPAEARKALTEALDRVRSSPLIRTIDVSRADQESTATGAVIAFTLEAALKETPTDWATEVSL